MVSGSRDACREYLRESGERDDMKASNVANGSRKATSQYEAVKDKNSPATQLGTPPAYSRIYFIQPADLLGVGHYIVSTGSVASISTGQTIFLYISSPIPY